MDKDTYADVFATTDWDLWCEQFIKDGRSNVDPLQSESGEPDRE